MIARLIKEHPLAFFTLACALFGLFWFLALASIPPYPTV